MWQKLLWQDCVGSYRLSQSWLQLTKKLVVLRDSIGRWKANKSRFWKREWKWKEKIQTGRLECHNRCPINDDHCVKWSDRGADGNQWLYFRYS